MKAWTVVLREAKGSTGPEWESHPDWSLGFQNGLLIVRAPQVIQDRVAGFVRAWRLRRTGIDAPGIGFGK